MIPGYVLRAPGALAVVFTYGGKETAIQMAFKERALDWAVIDASLTSSKNKERISISALTVIEIDRSTVIGANTHVGIVDREANIAYVEEQVPISAYGRVLLENGFI